MQSHSNFMDAFEDILNTGQLNLSKLNNTVFDEEQLVPTLR